MCIIVAESGECLYQPQLYRGQTILKGLDRNASFSGSYMFYALDQK